jgi:HlyD family secretion protein
MSTTANSTKRSEQPSDPRRELERALGAVEGGRRWIGRVVALVLVIGAVYGYIRWRKAHPPPKPARFMTEEVTLGDVTETIQSTGTVQPVTQVQVGAQVSGRIAKRYVDFNSVVKKGDLLAEIDPAILSTAAVADSARVESARAAVAGDEAAVALAKTNYERAVLLRSQGLLGEADLITAKGNLEAAEAKLRGSRASLNLAGASLKTSQTNLAFTKIYAPIDGVVIARNVDVGQTVAASFQTPVLFTIAQDLKQMLVLADIDEADLGRLSKSEHPEVDVGVEAFPGEVFPGTLKEVRFNATTMQGVVTYPAVISVANPDLKLRPGMTATVSIRTASAKAVLRVPNAALRFKPTPPLGPDGKPKPFKPEPPPPRGRGRIFIPPTSADGEPTPTMIDIGISDGLFTVVLGGVAAGTKVVVDETDENAEKRKQKGLF